MHRTLVLPGHISIDAYALFFILSWIAGGIVFYLEIRRRHWPLETMLFVMVGCLFGALGGAALLSVIFLDWSEMMARLTSFQLPGKTVIGGIAGGFLGVEITKKIVGYPHSTGDAFALAIPLGQAIGRIGCFLGGCCFGTVTGLPWAVHYPAGAPAHLIHSHLGLVDARATTSLGVHPAPLYELCFDLGVFALLFFWRDRFSVRGTLFRLYLALYAGYRFVAEFYRGDSQFPSAGGLKPVQYLLIAAALYYGFVVFRNSRTKSAK